MSDDKAANGRRYAAAFGVDLMRGERGLMGKEAGADDEAPSASGTSIFDPVLAELLIRWFSPPTGTVLDPFAGGSVRGVVSAVLGRTYTGIDLRAEQVVANREQWEDIRAGRAGAAPRTTISDPEQLTPIEGIGDVWVKRDDLFEVAGAPGGKVRTCLALARQAQQQGMTLLTTAGSRASPQVNIVARIAAHLGMQARCHTPKGTLAPEVEAAQAAGAEIIQHTPGHNSVIIARARQDAEAQGGFEIPFGMECAEAITQTRRQVANLPAEVDRIVAPVGSGMSLCGIVWGLHDIGRLDVEVIGVLVGADPTDRLNKFMPPGWRDTVSLVVSAVDYHDPAPETQIGHLALDAHYEAKCLPYLQPGDLLWVVGIRATAVEQATAAAPAPIATAGDARWIVGDSADLAALVQGETFDFILSCPPYADLEVYSDDPRDISTMAYPEFMEAYRRIIAASAAALKPNRFAAFVVGEVRGKDGNYLGFVPDTIRAFEAAGLKFYNEAIIVTPAGSLPLRTPRQFAAGRKLGKTHQNALIFVKGDAKKATQAIGEVEFGDFLPDSGELSRVAPKET